MFPQNVVPSGNSALPCDRHYRLQETFSLYESLLTGLCQMSPEIHTCGFTPEQISDTLHRILLDHPQLCHFEGQWTGDSVVRPIYTLSPDHMDTFQEVLGRITDQFSHTSGDREKAEQVFRWLSEHVTYDPAAPRGQSAYGALVEHRAVCKGIAKAFQLILRNLGIPCLLVEGSLDGQADHVWNYCRVDGQWRHWDVTLGYPLFSSRFGGGDPTHFLGLETREMIRTHTIHSFDPLPGEGHFFYSLSKGKTNPPPELTLPSRLLIHCSGIPRHIGTGSVSFVYRTTYRDKPAALKVVPCGLDLSKLYYATRECAMMDLVRNCPGIVPMLEFDIHHTDNGFTLFQLQEYMTPLDAYCLRRPMTVHRALNITRDICIALAECRKAGVAHLDIQPGNLYVDAEGHGRLGDFSAALPVEELNGLRQLRGTPAYMAPEVQTRFCYSEQSDMYSLGLVLYSLLSGGQLPFLKGNTLSQATQQRMNGDRFRMPEGTLRAFLDKVCAYSPEDRFPGLTDMQQALEELLSCCEDTLLPLPGAAPRSEDHSAVTQSALCQSTFPQWSWQDQVTSKIAPSDPTDPAIGNSLIEPNTWCETLPMDAPVLIDQDTQWDSDPAAYTAPLEVLRESDPAAWTIAPRPLRQADPAAYSVALASPPPESVRVDQVQFSAVAPQTALKGEYTLVQLYMYEQDFRHAVEEALQSGDGPMQEKKTGFFRVQDNTRVKVVLSSTDVEIPDDTSVQLWTGGYLVFDFALEIPFLFPKRQILLKASVYFDDVPATRLLLTMKTRSLREQKLELERADVISAFVSYASQDRARVGALVQGMRKARPDMDIFFDVNSLRSGENWEAALMREIERRDTLFLCWSNNARLSPWVDREWRYALAQKGADAIEPIPIDPPDLCPPPEELKSKHFGDSMLYIINR